MRTSTAIFSTLAMMAAAGGLVSAQAQAQTQSPPTIPADMVNVSGSVQQWDGKRLSLKTADGVVQVTASRHVNITTSRHGTLADVRPGEFVGCTAVQGRDGRLRAQEIHILPGSMRGAGEGHRPMGAPNTTMTNGDVTTINRGKVALTGAGTAGSTITLTYRGGSQQIDVPENVPITVISVTKPSAIKPGTQVMVVGRKTAQGTVSAQMISITK
jgi:hypothetical protein